MHFEVTKTRKAAILCRFLFILMPLHHQAFYVSLGSSSSNEVTTNVLEFFKILSEARFHLCRQSINSVNKIVLMQNCASVIEIPTGNIYCLLTVCLQISCWALYMYYFIHKKADSTVVPILQIRNLRFRLRFCLKLYNFLWENLDSNPSLSLKLNALNYYIDLPKIKCLSVF